MISQLKFSPVCAELNSVRKNRGDLALGGGEVAFFFSQPLSSQPGVCLCFQVPTTVFPMCFIRDTAQR